MQFPTPLQTRSRLTEQKPGLSPVSSSYAKLNQSHSFNLRRRFIPSSFLLQTRFLSFIIESTLYIVYQPLISASSNRLGRLITSTSRSHFRTVYRFTLP